MLRLTDFSILNSCEENEHLREGVNVVTNKTNIQTCLRSYLISGFVPIVGTKFEFGAYRYVAPQRPKSVLYYVIFHVTLATKAAKRLRHPNTPTPALNPSGGTPFVRYHSRVPRKQF